MSEQFPDLSDTQYLGQRAIRLYTNVSQEMALKMSDKELNYSWKVNYWIHLYCGRTGKACEGLKTFIDYYHTFGS